jgi:UDP-N-acetylmuramyl pentapeptide phosphotransferase/UDP-N-acetylglucosamine-1-phosphate transferase
MIGLVTILKLSFKYRWFDVPGDRSSHNRIVPRTAGISIFIISFLSLLFFGPTSFNSPIVFVSYVTFFLIGVVDDFKDINANTKFWGQLIIAVSLAIALPNFRIDHFYGVLGLYKIDDIPSIFFTSFVFIVVINAYNLIDGVDGLATTFAIFAFVLIGSAFQYTQPSIFDFCMLSSVILLPFYFFNFSKSRKMFLGDTGSLFLGLTIVLLVGYLLNSQNAVSIPYNINRALFALVALCYPLLDTLRVFTLRIAKGKSPFTADKNHLHHKLLGFGFNHCTTTLSLLSFNICIFLVNAFCFKNTDVNAILIVNFIIIAALLILGQRVSIWFSKRNNQ